MTACSGDATREPTKRIHKPHCFGKAWRLALDHTSRTLRSLVPRRKSGTSGRDDEAIEVTTEFDERLSDHLFAVAADTVFHHLCAMCSQGFNERNAGRVLSGSSDHPVAHREHLGAKNRH
jgi:hypothetical protein